MFYAHGYSGVDGGAVVCFAAGPEGRVVVVHGYARCRDKEERSAAGVGAGERVGLVEVGIADSDVLIAQVAEFVAERAG